MGKYILVLFLSLSSILLSNCTLKYDCMERNAFQGVWYVNIGHQDDNSPRKGARFEVNASGEFLIPNFHGNGGMNHYQFYMPSERYGEYVYIVRILDSNAQEVTREYLKLRINTDNLFSSDLVSQESLVGSQLSQFLFAVSERVAPTYGYV